MIKRPPQAIIILVIILCFGIGLLNVFLKAPDDSGLPNDGFSPAPTQPSDTSIRSILILGVNDLGRETPIVRAIWIAAFQQPEQNIYLHGVPLDMPVSSKGSVGISELFAWAPHSGIDRNFLEGLYEILPLHPDMTVIMDETAFVRAIDYLQGVNIEGEEIDGESVLAFLSLSWDKPKILLEDQALIIQAMIPKALNQPEALELTDLVDLIPEHAFISLDLNQAIAFINPLRNIDPNAVFLILLDGE